MPGQMLIFGSHTRTKTLTSALANLVDHLLVRSSESSSVFCLAGQTLFRRLTGRVDLATSIRHATHDSACKETRANDSRKCAPWIIVIRKQSVVSSGSTHFVDLIEYQSRSLPTHDSTCHPSASDCPWRC